MCKAMFCSSLIHDKDWLWVTRRKCIKRQPERPHIGPTPCLGNADVSNFSKLRFKQIDRLDNTIFDIGTTCAYQFIIFNDDWFLYFSFVDAYAMVYSAIGRIGMGTFQLFYDFDWRRTYMEIPHLGIYPTDTCGCRLFATEGKFLLEELARHCLE